jgi:cell wall-associated NlpC family hydrolase
MPTVRVVFARRRALGSLLLRTFLWSAWSHVAIIDGDGDDALVIEAAAGGGVRSRPLAELLEESSEFEIVPLPARSAIAVIAAARSQIGKPYDWLGAAGIAARRRWQDGDRWFCSELVAWAFARGGSPLVRVEEWRITPRDLYQPIFQPA